MIALACEGEMVVVKGPLADKVADSAEDVETALLAVVVTAEVTAVVEVAEVEVAEMAEEVVLVAIDVVVMGGAEVDDTVEEVDVTDAATEVDTTDVLAEVAVVEVEADAADRTVVNADAVVVALAVVDVEVVVEEVVVDEVLLLSPGRTSCPKGSCLSMMIIIEGPATMLSLAAVRFLDPAP